MATLVPHAALSSTLETFGKFLYVYGGVAFANHTLPYVPPNSPSKASKPFTFHPPKGSYPKKAKKLSRSAANLSPPGYPVQIMPTSV